MPVNRNALIRFRTIDNCLKNKYRRWTLEDLIEACSEALYEYEGIGKGVSRRTVQMDLQLMRSDKLGYNAPIIVKERKYYCYDDPDYSITNIPLNEQDLQILSETTEILRQFKGFSHFSDLSGMVQKLEDRINTAKLNAQPVIDLEKNEHLKGLNYIDTIYQAILKKRPLKFTYQSFKAREESRFTFHPYLLKEYRNRWFVVGHRPGEQMMLVLALDRIKEIEESYDVYIENTAVSMAEYFRDVIGVSVNPNAEAEWVELFVNHANAPYVLTKPFHHSQQLISRESTGIAIRLQVQLNFELEREILGFGNNIRVIYPPLLRKRIRSILREAAEQYDFVLNSLTMQKRLKSLKRAGFALFNDIYTQKEINKMAATINHVLKYQQPSSDFAIRNLLKTVPDLKQLIYNHNLFKIIENGFGKGYFLTKAVYFNKPPTANWVVPWHQDIPINVKGSTEAEGFNHFANKNGQITVCPPIKYLHNAFTIRIHLDDTDEENGALRVIPKTHFGILTPEEINHKVNAHPSYCCEMKAGGIHIMKPLLLHSSRRSADNKPRRVIHLEFNNMELPDGMDWSERDELMNSLERIDSSAL